MSGLGRRQQKISKTKQAEMIDDEFHQLVEHKKRVLQEEALAQHLQLLEQGSEDTNDVEDRLRITSAKRGQKRQRPEEVHHEGTMHGDDDDDEEQENDGSRSQDKEDEDENIDIDVTDSKHHGTKLARNASSDVGGGRCATNAGL
jgi:hypothetical protein